MPGFEPQLNISVGRLFKGSAKGRAAVIFLCVAYIFTIALVLGIGHGFVEYASSIDLIGRLSDWRW